MKRCTKCGEEKELSEFYLARQTGKYKAACKACVRAHMLERYWSDPESHRAEGREQWVIHREDRRKYRDRYYAEHAAEQNAKRRQQRLDDPEKWRAKDRAYAKLTGRNRKALFTRHGITAQIFDELLISQNGVCAICGGPPNGKGVYHIDHDHTTGRIRGLLCHSCNTSLGHWRDDVQLLEAAIGYLQKHLPGA